MTGDPLDGEVPPEFQGLTVEEMREAAAALTNAVDFAQVIRYEVADPVVVEARVTPRVAEALVAVVARLRAEGKWPSA